MLARLTRAAHGQDQDKDQDKDRGFTLIELLVVIVIIGILAAIAIPLFLNQREKGVDAGIQSDLKSLATTEETIYTDKGAYSATATDITAAGFKKTGDNEIAVALSGGGFCLRGYDEDGSRDAVGNAYWYDSLSGGLSNGPAAPTGGACAGTALAWTTL